MTVTVLIPWRPGCPHRDRNLHHILNLYQHNGWHTCLTTHLTGPWSKGSAVAAAGPLDGLVVIADADVWCHELADAVAAVGAGAPWAIPHHNVLRWDEPSTADLISGRPPTHLEQKAYRGIAGGGLVVLPADTLRAVPLDPRFEGWGGEDGAWGTALATLTGKPWRGTADLHHLWHPPQPRRTRRGDPHSRRGSIENENLRRRYQRAAYNPPHMRKIIKEVTDAAPCPR